MRGRAGLPLAAGAAALLAAAPAAPLPVPAMTDPAPDSLPAAVRAFQRLDAEGYLPPLLALEALAAAPAGGGAPEDALARELLGWTRAMVGDDAGALALERAAPPPPDDTLPPGFDALRPAPAVDAIVAGAAATRLVMVNEAHHVPRHRALTRELLAPLHALGYRYLAVEAVGRRAAAGLNERGHAVRATGTYTKDPVFAELLREARALGYTIVAYDTFPAGCRPAPEDPNRCTTLRERLGAEALWRQTFARDSGAKVLMHVGFDHVLEAPRPGGARWIAAWLAERGLDPLTVDQTEMRERADPAAAPAAYRAAEARGWLAGGPVVLRGVDGTVLRSAAYAGVDLQVLTPPTALRDGRPSWRFDGGRRAVRVPLGRGPLPALVQAFRETDGPDAVPADQAFVRTGDAATLALRPGRWRVVVLGPEGERAVHMRDVR